MMIRTKQNWEEASKSLQKKASKALAIWQKRLWHLSAQAFACEVDAEEAWNKTISQLPIWLQASKSVVGEPHSGKAGRPRGQTEPVRTSWKIVPTVQINQQALERAADQQARFLLATNELSTDKLTDEALLAVYKDQGGVERGFRFLKDPWFLASSVTVSKPSRLIALSFLMVLCWLIYRLAEHRLRQRLRALRANHSQSAELAHCQTDYALGVPML